MSALLHDVKDTITLYRLKGILDELYEKYNHREYVNPDPLIFLYDYHEISDREIVALIASSLAYGRVQQIIRSVDAILRRMKYPSLFVLNESEKSIFKAFKGFKHRFTSGDDISRMLIGVKHVINKYGSLENCFKEGFNPHDDNYTPALIMFSAEIRTNGKCRDNGLLPCPSDGSACKRWNLFLKWMIRKDEVDPGGWNLPSSKLLIPLDTHMHKISLALEFTRRKQADLKAAIEVTNIFRQICPTDPVKYDFALTRLGIRNESSIDNFIQLITQERGIIKSA